MNESSVVLVIEDEKPVREIVGEILKEAGYRVALADDGDTGLELFRSENPDAVVLDIRMPRVNGFDVLASIRKSSDCPVIMLTALGGVSDKLRALDDGGADAYLVKPIGADELIARVRSVLRRTKG